MAPRPALALHGLPLLLPPARHPDWAFAGCKVYHAITLLVAVDGIDVRVATGWYEQPALHAMRQEVQRVRALCHHAMPSHGTDK